MANPKIVLCTETLIRDKETDVISAINIIETIAVKSFPIAISKINFFVLLEKEDSDTENIEYSVKGFINDKEVISGPCPVHFQGKNTARLIVTLAGIAITEIGNLKIALFDHEKEITFYTISIRLIDNPSVNVHTGT